MENEFDQNQNEPVEDNIKTESAIIEPASNNNNNKCSKSAIFTKINFFGNIVILIVLVVLFFSHHGKQNESSQNNFPMGNSTSKIAFLNTDTVFSNYLMVKDLQDELNTKKTKLENEVMAMQKAFQTKLTNYQSNVQNNRITYDQAQAAEKKLMKERDDIVALGERYSNDIAALEFQIHQQITDSIINFTNRYNKTYQADYILGYTKGGGILVANPKFEITMDILKGLNEEYEKSKNSK